MRAYEVYGEWTRGYNVVGFTDTLELEGRTLGAAIDEGIKHLKPMIPENADSVTWRGSEIIDDEDA